MKKKRVFPTVDLDTPTSQCIFVTKEKSLYETINKNLLEITSSYWTKEPNLFYYHCGRTYRQRSRISSRDGSKFYPNWYLVQCTWGPTRDLLYVSYVEILEKLEHDFRSIECQSFQKDWLGNRRPSRLNKCNKYQVSCAGSECLLHSTKGLVSFFLKRLTDVLLFFTYSRSCIGSPSI